MPQAARMEEARTCGPAMECLKKAVKSKGLERSFKMAIPPEVYQALEKEMEKLEQ